MNWKRYAEACMVEQPDMWTSLETWILYHDPNDDQKRRKSLPAGGSRNCSRFRSGKRISGVLQQSNGTGKNTGSEEAL